VTFVQTKIEIKFIDGKITEKSAKDLQ